MPQSVLAQRAGHEVEPDARGGRHPLFDGVGGSLEEGLLGVANLAPPVAASDREEHRLVQHTDLHVQNAQIAPQLCLRERTSPDTSRSMGQSLRTTCTPQQVATRVM